MRKNLKRNSLAVRVDDSDYDAFLITAGRQYSETLRELISVYTDNYKAKDAELPLAVRVKTVMNRVPKVKEAETKYASSNRLLKEKKMALRGK